ncbi:hypothetical protein CDL12_14423 [Handroanthus impetiginosus]|uniref:Uncharacterized protein n=1 Tax=Handroanthus impetiginosus TaxID=429701 RepID=A0A2G9H663_9LAMI|nr:hypothetical protein CDL12_14423 [Handroanthus impetiginosus]
MAFIRMHYVVCEMVRRNLKCNETIPHQPYMEPYAVNICIMAPSQKKGEKRYDGMKILCLVFLETNIYSKLQHTIKEIQNMRGN